MGHDDPSTAPAPGTAAAGDPTPGATATTPDSPTPDAAAATTEADDSRTAELATQLVRLRATTERLRAAVLSHGNHGLEGSALAVLHLLACDGRHRPSALAERLGLDPSTMSRHVSALVRGGYLERVPDPDDGRASLLRLTPAGLAAHDDTQRLRGDVLDVALAAWPDADVARLTTVLTRFVDAFADRDHDALVRAARDRRLTDPAPQETP